jgi:hypothetical protein
VEDTDCFEVVTSVFPICEPLTLSQPFLERAAGFLIFPCSHFSRLNKFIESPLSKQGSKESKLLDGEKQKKNNPFSRINK